MANISSGLSASKRIEINEKLKPFWKQCEHRKCGRSTVVHNPPGMDFGSQTPDVWIQPEHSIIFEVNANEREFCFYHRSLNLFLIFVLMLAVGQSFRIGEQHFIRDTLLVKISTN